MSSLPKLQSLIRFQLSQLKVQNRHHDFEHLCKFLAKATVCQNVLPATGPVSSGGDQGRDAETFRTFLQSTPLASSSFIGFTTDKNLVFCCSLQKDIEEKIKADVATVVSNGRKPDLIYYYTEADIPVGKRHQLIEWAKQKHQVELEILDGQAISELLTNIDVFWIAEDFLDVPSDMYPQPKDKEETYENYKTKWIVEKISPQNLADFVEIKYGLRQATFDPKIKSGLLSWLKVMEIYLEPESPKQMRRRAIYEICVVELRGLNRLSTRKALIEEYFQSFEGLTDPAELKNVTTLLSYCSSASLQGAFDGDPAKIHEWSKRLIEHLETLLNKATNSGDKCWFLDLRGHAATLVYQDSIKPNRPTFANSWKFWNALLDEVPKAPLYPLEGLSDVLNRLTEYVENEPKLTELIKKTDAQLAARSGDYLPAEKCRDRAVILIGKGRHLAAIRELHDAKIKWFSAETLRGSLLSMMTLAESYYALGLLYAAKYYSTAAAWLAFYHDDERFRPLMSRALLRLTGYSFLCGEWFAFASLMKAALVAHNSFDSEVWDFKEHKDLQYVMSHALICHSILDRFAPEQHKQFSMIQKTWDIPNDLREAFEEMLANKSVFWAKAPENEIVASLAKDTYGQPCGDLGERRTISWNALGITWNVSFKNELQETLISEEIVATIQIISADIADKDLLFMRTCARLEIELVTRQTGSIKNDSTNKEGVWKVAVPADWIQNKARRSDLRRNVDVLAINILSECSALGSDKFMEVFEQAFKDGLPSKIFSVQPYSELYGSFLAKDEFNNVPRNQLDPLFKPEDFLHPANPSIDWTFSIAQTYTKAQAKEFITNRYRRGIKPIQKSIPKWLADKSFRDQLNALKAKGYKDWFILLMLSNIGVNYRINKDFPNASPQFITQQIWTYMDKEETIEEGTIPVEVFTEEAMKTQEMVSVASIAKTWGLELKNPVPNFTALAELLNVRFRNNQDDIPHDDIFEWGTHSNQNIGQNPSKKADSKSTAQGRRGDKKKK